jgi:hypothetical protein
MYMQRLLVNICMYACLSVHVCTCVTYISIRYISGFVGSAYVCMPVCTCVYVYIHKIHVCTCVYVICIRCMCGFVGSAYVWCVGSWALRMCGDAATCAM